MEEIGKFLGWATAVCFGMSIMSFVVKKINLWIIKQFEKESQLRMFYGKFMRFIIRNHMYFGIGAGALAISHLYIQISNGKTSLVGIMAVTLMILTILLGVAMKKIGIAKHKCLLYTHRSVVVMLLFTIIVHIILVG